jgi:fatty-acyl-CoA synthase
MTSPPTFPALIDCAAERCPPDVGLVLPEERAGYRDFAARSVELACRLRGAGVVRGDRVGLLFNSSVDSYALLVGAMRLGAMPVPINVRFRSRELEYVIAKAGMRLVVCEPRFADGLLEPGVAGSARIVSSPDDEEFVAAGSAVDAGEIAESLAALGPEDDALMLFTSGTTAHPKGCVHRHLALVAEGELFAERIGLGPGDRFWTPLPFFHVGGLDVLSAAAAGECANYQMPQFEAAVALDQLADGVTVAFPAFETIWLAVLGHERFAETDLTGLRLVINVAVPASLRSMQERFPSATQISCFGSTETTGFACLGVPEDSLEARTTTSGKPLRGIEVRVVDPETGAELPPGEQGELVVRGPTRFLRYHDDPDSTAATVDSNGWYHSGDLGRRDFEGRISFAGRLKDVLKVGGENVSAAEVEGLLVEHPAVEIVQVVGARDAQYTEVPAAFVQLRSGASATAEELIDFCRGKVATFKVPRYVRFVEEWPMSGTKIQKFRLREQLAAELDAAGIEVAPRFDGSVSA